MAMVSVMAQSSVHTLRHLLQGTVIVESVLSSAVTDADIIIEAVKEDRDIKNALFKGIVNFK